MKVLDRPRQTFLKQSQTKLQVVCLYHVQIMFRKTFLNELLLAFIRVLSIFLYLLTCISSLSSSCSTQPTLPSPEQTRTLRGAKCLNKRSPKRGPAPLSSNTWAGLRSWRKRRRNLTPWLSPVGKVEVISKLKDGMRP